MHIAKNSKKNKYHRAIGFALLVPSAIWVIGFSVSSLQAKKARAVGATLNVIGPTNVLPPVNNNNTSNNLPGNNVSNNNLPANNVSNNNLPGNNVANNNVPSNNVSNNIPGNNVPSNNVVPKKPNVTPAVRRPLSPKRGQLLGNIVTWLVGFFGAINLLFALPLWQWGTLIWRLFLLPFQWFRRRHRNDWGLVYNVLSHEPVSLATVRLFRVDRKGEHLQETYVTDKTGRYSFTIDKAGRYRVTVARRNFVFPSKLLKNAKEDGDLIDIYYGRIFEVKQADLITLNMPIDPITEHPPRAKIILRHYWRVIGHAIGAYAGLVINTAGLIVLRNLPSLIVWVIQVGLFLLYLYLARPPRIKPWGRVYDSSNSSALPRAIVRILNVKYGRVLETRVTDRLGRYGFLVRDDTYRMQAIHAGYTFPAKHRHHLHDYRGKPITIKRESDIKFDIPMDPLKRKKGRGFAGTAH